MTSDQIREFIYNELAKQVQKEESNSKYKEEFDKLTPKPEPVQKKVEEYKPPKSDITDPKEFLKNKLESPVFKSLDFLQSQMLDDFSKLKGKAFVFKTDQSPMMLDLANAQMKIMESEKIAN